MAATDLSLDSLTNPLRLVAANLLRHSLALLVGVRLGDVLVDSLAALVGVLKALLVDDLLLLDLLHLDAALSGDVVAVLPLHHLRLLLLNNRAILCRFFYAMFVRVRFIFRVDINRFARWVVAPRPGMLDRAFVAFHHWAFLADVVLVAVALLKHRGADVAGAPQLRPGDHPVVGSR